MPASQKLLDHLQRVAASRIGSKLSQETKLKIGAGNKGKLAGDRNHKWNGGKLMLGGYAYLLAKDHPNATKIGYVAEHRLVMESIIGRFLTRKEAVHHINHNRLDNRPENLELCESNGKHSVEHHIVRRADGRFA